ncbi:MAG: magnesium chelatase ATPase subunit I [Candidatus Methanomethylophilaceae archaeon]|nr:magnesium chelatase ATPase subunit I [Candidatus Methanomethylophilaceae archaeon]
MDSDRNLFPFVRIVGQEEMKLALLLNVVDPSIGGVLIRGEKGTAKSTTVRSVERILPPVPSSTGCRFHCDPRNVKNLCEECKEKLQKGELETYMRPMRVVELPLNATEDRISGSLDIEQVLATGKRKYEPGVLADANCNLLYVDEVNLLDDHIVDLLLDSAAMGRNNVDREGISFSHRSNFILLGPMNPEEGNLRPQLLDRFWMCVDVKGDINPDVRMEVIKRRLAFDEDPESYCQEYAAESDALREKLETARKSLKDIKISDDLIHQVAIVAIRFGMEGHRSDLAMIRAARANAALEGRNEVEVGDIAATAGMILRHRVKGGTFDQSTFKQEDLLRCLRGL